MTKTYPRTLAVLGAMVMAGCMAVTGQAAAQPPSDNAEYCRRTDPLEVALPEEDNRRQAPNDLARQAKIWQEVQPFAPWGLRSDLQLLAKDYDALSTGAKTFPEALPEVRPAFARVMEHRKAIC